MLSKQYNSRPIFRVLTALTLRSTLDPEATFKDLYNLVHNDDILYEAWGRIKNNKGVFTQGTNTTTADKISADLLTNIKEKLKQKTYKFQPVRRVYIPKPGKVEKRPLGIPCLEDRIVQQAMRMILECIYEPTFESIKTNFGFRPGIGCHNAIAKIGTEGTGLSCAIEGDIKGAYDNVKFNKLIEILSKKIKDKELLILIQKCLESGVMDEGVHIDTTIGVPQGGIISPLLFNIYMHEFDLYVLREITQILEQKNISENRKVKASSVPHNAIRSRVHRARKALKEILYNKTYKALNLDEQKKVKELFKKFKTAQLTLIHTPYLNHTKRTLKLSYTRYADDWIIITNTTTKFAYKLKNIIGEWLNNNLMLTLSESKTKVTNLIGRPSTPAKFLGFDLYVRSSRRISKLKSGLDLEFRRTAGWNIIVQPDYEKLIKRYSLDGFCTEKGKPTPKTAWTTLPDFEIIGRYNLKLSGVFNYFVPMCSEKSKISRIFYILFYSCLYTLARKHNKKISDFLNNKRCIINFDARYQTFFPNVTMPKEKLKVFKKLRDLERGGESIDWQEKQLTRQIELFTYKQLCDNVEKLLKEKYTINRMGYRKPIAKGSNKPEDYLNINFVNWRTSYKLNQFCCICGATKDIENHHIRHINKGKVIGFAQKLKQLNRRQIPVCKECHLKIHKGEYDNLKLSEFYDATIIIL